jgi:hypothetical protein
MQTILPKQIGETRSVFRDDQVQVKQISRYVKDRQNQDGGYTFAQWTESSAEDTYFALQILKILGIIPEHREDTIQFLQGLHNADGSYDSIKAAYYCISALDILGATPNHGVSEFVNSLKRPYGGFGSLDVNIETSSELEATYLALSVLKSYDEVRPGEIIQFILGRMNSDGTFGSGCGYSTLASVHFALASLRLLGHDVRSLDRTLQWIRHCEPPNGGFTSDPRNAAYLVLDDVYYGLNVLCHFRISPQYPQASLQLVSRFQNGNGGFRRSIFLGISTFESTYFALSCLKLLSRDWPSPST